MSRRRRRWSRRQKLWLSIASTLVATAVLVLGALWIQARRETDAGDPAHGVTARARAAMANAVAPPLRFTDVAVESGLDVVPAPGPRGRTLPEDTGAGLAFGDYDADGDPDLYLVGFPGPLTEDDQGLRARGAGRSYLFRNDGGRFTDVTEAAGVANPGSFGMGARFADYDGDGHLDLFVTNFGPDRLYRNQGDGTFRDVAAAAGVADAGWSTGAAFGDYDRDGHLDLYVCRYLDYDVAGLVGPDLAIAMDGRGYQVPFALNPNGFDPAPNRLYRNRGDGTFEQVAEEVGVDNPDGRSLAATFCDLDGDGWLDLYVNNDVSPNRLFRNLGAMETPARFVDLSTISGTADPRGSMGLSVIEAGHLAERPDGLPDLFISHWVAQENALYLSLRTPGGGLEYRDRNRKLGLGELSLDTVGWGSFFGDLDRDGRPDLVVVNGSTLEDKADTARLIAERPFVFWNAGDRFFERGASCGTALAGPHGARGLAAADYDGDGDLDLAVSVNRGRPLLLRNDTPTENGALIVRLAGTPAACFGARVEITVGDARQVQWYAADASFLSDHGRDLLFGLGTAPMAQELRVRFTDGREVVRADVRAGLVHVSHPDS